ncbi:MAG: DNA polymerase IV [Thermaerobacterales bacterium]
MAARKEGERVVLLCDLDAFFAAVEVLDHPELAGRPVVVGGDPDSRGVVATCNYEARRYGIGSAMPLREARRRCPDAVFLPARHERYREVSSRVFAIFRQFTPQIEAVSIDEAYLDLTGGEGPAAAAAIRQAVRSEEGLAVSVGVGSNKFLAKIACELAKPDGVKEINAADAQGVLAPLPVRSLPGVGPKTAERLQEAGLRTIADLQQRREFLLRRFGRQGAELLRLSDGVDDRPVDSEGGPAKSISDETTFSADRRAGELLPVLMDLAEQVGYRLRKAGLRCQTVTIKVRFPDFQTITRSRTFSQPLDSDDAINRHARTLYEQHILSGGGPPGPGGERRGLPPLIRLLGVQVSNLSAADAPLQTTLWQQDQPPRDEVIADVIDNIRDRFGRGALMRGAVVDPRRGPPSTSQP